MPRASGRQVKYHYLDNDGDVVDESPPILNNWYELFDAEDVALLWCRIYQTNDEAAAKNIETRWTIDGNVYFRTISVANAVGNYIYRTWVPSGGGTAGLLYTTNQELAVRYAPKHGHSFKAEVRITSALGTNQRLFCHAVKETLTET